MSVTLNPGSYALIIASEHFGASGRGGMPYDNPPLVDDESIIGYNSLESGGWFSTEAHPEGLPRFVVEGVVIPEPSMAILAVAALGILRLRTRHARTDRTAAKGAFTWLAKSNP